MYLRQTRATDRHGRTVSYLQLAHNRRDPDTDVPKAEMIHSFGRADRMEREGLARLVRSISRFLGPAEAVVASSGEEVEIVDSRPLGGSLVLDHLWSQLGIDRSIKSLLSGPKLDPRVEQVLFALVANRALEPLSKLGATQWVRERVFIPGVGKVDDDSRYRAMDFLLECEEELAQAVYFSTAELLDL